MFWHQFVWKDDEYPQGVEDNIICILEIWNKDKGMEMTTKAI